MLKKDLSFFLEDFPDDIEVCFWSNGKAHPVEIVKDDKTRNCILLNARNEQPVEKKSNALFEECLANVDPAIRKEVSDNIDKMNAEDDLEKEVAAFIKYLEDNEKAANIRVVARHFAEWGAEHLKK